MENEWLDVAYINHDEAILHGQIVDGHDKFHVTIERQVRKVLSDDEKRQIENLNSDNQELIESIEFKHQLAMKKLLIGFARAAS